jgi:uncharacterized protein YecE (DUF72 family)
MTESAPASERESKRARVGTSGFSYSDWKGLFYPDWLPSRDWFHFYATKFSAVEINLTFYRTPSESTLRKWRESVSAGFAFTLKASQEITHRLRLRDCDDEFTRMVDAYSPLGSQLACILFQLPPSLQVDEDQLGKFLEAALCRLERTPIRPRLAVEFRHPSWNRLNVFARLAGLGCAPVVHDMRGAGGWHVEDHTLRADPSSMTRDEFLEKFAAFLYLRFHGTDGQYAGDYGRERLDPWARLAQSALAHELAVHAYFNNTMAGDAVRDAMRFESMLST